MKYVILVGDGMGDYPMAELGGKTPLEAAKTPSLDELARRGELGCARTIPPGKEPGSDIANLAIMGYDPVRYHTGRAPLEAAALGVDQALREIETGRGRTYDPAVVDACLRLFREKGFKFP